MQHLKYYVYRIAFQKSHSHDLLLKKEVFLH